MDRTLFVGNMRILDSNLELKESNARGANLKSALHTLSALILAPVLGGSIVGAVIGIHTVLTTVGHPMPADYILGFAVTLGVFAGMWGGPGALLLGLPAHHKLLKSRITNPLAYIVVFALIGGASMAVVFGFMIGQLRSPNLSIMFLATTCGAVGGLVFWLIRRPDRMAYRTRITSVASGDPKIP